MTDIKDLSRLQDQADWQHAENLYRSGEPDKLARMLRSRKAIPRGQRVFLAELVEGKINVSSMRGKKNAKLTYEQRARIHDVLRRLRWMQTAAKRQVGRIADENKLDVIDVMKHFAAERAAIIAELARTYGVSKKSIPTIARRFKEVSPLSPAVLAKIRKKQ